MAVFGDTSFWLVWLACFCLGMGWINGPNSETPRSVAAREVRGRDVRNCCSVSELVVGDHCCEQTEEGEEVLLPTSRTAFWNKIKRDGWFLLPINAVMTYYTVDVYISLVRAYASYSTPEPPIYHQTAMAA